MPFVQMNACRVVYKTEPTVRKPFYYGQTDGSPMVSAFEESYSVKAPNHIIKLLMPQ